MIRSSHGVGFERLSWVVMAMLVLLAWFNRFIQDDAFISFRYALNLVNGNGLVFNPGERVEGYTNFLWTLAMGIPMYFKSDPVLFSLLLGILLYLLTLFLTLRVSTIMFKSKGVALVAVLLLGTNYTFSSYATGGLETQFQTCMFMAVLYVLWSAQNAGHWSKRAMLAFSLLLSVATLARPDSMLFVAMVLPVGLYYAIKGVETKSLKAINALIMLVPFTIVIGAWLFWKWSYYGDILPNTFYAKVESTTSAWRGAYYVYIFLFSYWLIPFPLLLAATVRRWLFRPEPRICLLVALVGVWLAYVVMVGGDFMEFRFLVPILPPMAILGTWLIFVPIQQREVRIALVAIILLGSLHHALTFGKSTNLNGIETFEQLSGHVENPQANWRDVGRVLGESFRHDPGVLIATTAAGAIPYESGLTTVDMLGLNDKWVARHGKAKGSRPGHQRIAPLDYLVRRGVNIVVGHPWIEPIAASIQYTSADLEHLMQSDITEDSPLPSHAEMLEIPLKKGFKLIVVYLLRNPTVDEAIRRNGWRVHQIENHDVRADHVS
ncbi:MAG: hypothetical protein GXP54_04610 [Deltaproteobacteria bacterium]|nr:hypothetical protein [Deltaproteobacteria bacterium]